MSHYQNDLIQYLQPLSNAPFPQESLQKYTERNLSSIFTDCLYLKSALEFVIEDHWVQSKEKEINFEKFIKVIFKKELKQFLYLHELLQTSSLEKIKLIQEKINKLETALLQEISRKDSSYQVLFLKIFVSQMSDLYEFERQLNFEYEEDQKRSKLSLYRSFDILDDILGIKYNFKENPHLSDKERLYEGAGVGVQSSYSTPLLALRYINLPKGAQVIDLGSGYGRIGFALGLLRSDLKFTGYEYVADRVQSANQICQKIQIDQNVQFIKQDLSDPHFKIPVAEAYYIFDSFTDQTFEYVMQQLNQYSLNHQIILITKGNARLWVQAQYWSEPQKFQGGNLCLYRSKGQAYRAL